jgi:hypothetical protein
MWGFAYMIKKFGAVILLALLAACASGEYSGSSGKTLIVSKQVWGWYKDYVTKISGVNKGVFVVGVDRGVAVTASAWYCPATSCMAENYGKKAFDSCRSFGADLECIKFATSASILVNYKVEE